MCLYKLLCGKLKLTFSSLVATADLSKFAGTLSAALSQNHLFFPLFYFTILYWFAIHQHESATDVHMF